MCMLRCGMLSIVWGCGQAMPNVTSHNTICPCISKHYATIPVAMSDKYYYLSLQEYLEGSKMPAEVRNIAHTCILSRIQWNPL